MATGGQGLLGEKFTCRICGQEDLTEGEMRSHDVLMEHGMATGSQGLLGEKFTCLICGQEDLTEGEMRSHVLVEHVECNMCCPFCDLSGITSDEMNVHINSVHFDDLMSPIEKSKKSNGQGKMVVGREDAEKFGKEHGGAIPKTKLKSGLKHSQSLEQNSPTHKSPKKSPGMKSSQSETNIDKRGKLQLNFTSVNVPGGSPRTMKTSMSSQALRGSTSSQSLGTSSSMNSIRESSSYEGFNGSVNKNEEPSNCVTSRLRIQNGNYGQNEVIFEESHDNNNAPLQPNLNQTSMPDINDNVAPDINSNMPAGFSCPLCQFITSSENLIQTHVNMEHVDVLSPARPHSRPVGDATDSAPSSSTGTRQAAQDGTQSNHISTEEYPCPICMQIFHNSGELSLHVNEEHTDIFSPDKVKPGFSGTSMAEASASTSQGLVCPVCGLSCNNRFKLEAHVNGHFSAAQTPVQEKNDKLIAQALQEKENMVEQKEFQKLQAMYGMVDGTPFKKQYEKNLEKAVVNGDLSVVEYHERKIGFKQADIHGVDDGTSCTKGVIQRLQEYYRTPTHGVSKTWLTTGCDHYSGSYGDRGWGCGYRNFQMLLSALMSDTTYAKVLYNGKPLMPSIPKIQQLIENAWKKGFDRQGCDQLGGRVFNTTKWIGATEIVATLASLKVKCQLVDFHSPSGANGTHPKLFEYVKNYFEKPSTFKPPLYLQHQGHSRTIIGIEELKDKRLRLLIFDPSTPKKQMQLFHSIVNANIMRTLRRTQEGLKAKEYQIVAVTGIIPDKDVEAHKVLNATRLS